MKNNSFRNLWGCYDYLVGGPLVEKLTYAIYDKAHIYYCGGANGLFAAVNLATYTIRVWPKSNLEIHTNADPVLLAGEIIIFNENLRFKQNYEKISSHVAKTIVKNIEKLQKMIYY